MKEDYVSFETAKLFKEKGFKEPTLTYYCEDGYLCNPDWYDDWNYKDSTSFSAPTLQMAAKWLREKFGVYINVSAFASHATKSGWAFAYEIKSEQSHTPDNISFSSYEEALDAGIVKALELIK